MKLLQRLSYDKEKAGIIFNSGIAATILQVME
jgi:hypothetical protein